MQTMAELTQIDVYTGGVDGVHTYRIPSLIAAPGGALLAFCEARKISGGDASPTDMVLKRSLDGGETWRPMQVLVRGEGEEAIMNPCPVVDGGTVRLFCMNAHKKARNHHRHLLLESGDDGALGSAAWGPAAVGRAEVGVLGACGGPGALEELGLEPAVAGGGPAGAALAGALVVARTHAGPGCRAENRPRPVADP